MYLIGVPPRYGEALVLPLQRTDFSQRRPWCLATAAPDQCLSVDDLLAEGHARDGNQLEVGDAEGDTDSRQAQSDARD